MPPELDRRALLRLAGGAVLVAGCGVTSSGGGRGVLGGGRPSPSPTLEPAARYVPLPSEPVPNGKQAAADFVQALTSAPAGRSGSDVLAATGPLLAAGFDVEATLRVAAPLFNGEASAGDIVYPQLGGLVPLSEGAQKGSVMVIVRQRRLAAGGTVEAVTRVCDVRIVVENGQWRVSELAAAGGEPVERPDGLDPVATQVLDDPRIELPDTCRWDIHAGRISLDLLDVLRQAAVLAPLAVTVLATGHPVNVFGTDNVSNHTDGRAVDVWRIGGQPVVTTGAAQGPAGALLRAAFDDPRVKQTGSPPGSDLDGGGSSRSFVNIVHEDHLHLAVTSGPPG